MKKTIITAFVLAAAIIMSTVSVFAKPYYIGGVEETKTTVKEASFPIFEGHGTNLPEAKDNSVLPKDLPEDKYYSVLPKGLHKGIGAYPYCGYDLEGPHMYI